MDALHDTPTPALDITDVIARRRLVSHLQPLVSVKRRSVIGYEALARGRGDNGGVVCPADLFAAACDFDTRLALDRLCRECAVEAFAGLHKNNRGLVLSINVDATIIGKRTRNSRHLMDAVKARGLSPNNVIIEIIESSAPEFGELVDFVEHYRKNGFLIALDDFGAGHSNLDRIAALRPDVLKLDRSLVGGVHEHFHQQEVVKSFVRMAERIGAMVLAEGTERIEEVLALMDLGVDVFQGFFFARPAPEEPDLKALGETFEALSRLYRTGVMERIAADKQLYAVYDALLSKLCRRLTAPRRGRLDQALIACLEEHQGIECLYVLDSAGTQVSGTICNPLTLSKKKRFIYEPAAPGADHSLKEYVIPLKAGLRKYTTEPYLSLASGNRCITISTIYYDPEAGCDRILCMDIAQPF